LAIHELVIGDWRLTDSSIADWSIADGGRRGCAGDAPIDNYQCIRQSAILQSVNLQSAGCNLQS
jgi:hypothetical protein